MKFLVSLKLTNWLQIFEYLEENNHIGDAHYLNAGLSFRAQ